jgi:spore coat polysaccharide biosynthesis protein SpsF
MIGAIIQARTSSTRLPGKVLLELPYGSGITVLQQVIRRLKQSKKIEAIIVATTEDESDNAIVDIASREDVSSFRGSKENVLERYYLAAKASGLDTVVRITSDCPCVDASIVDSLITQHMDSNADYTSNALIRTYPHGLDAEVVSLTTLTEAYNKAKQDYEKEHVTPFIYKTNPDKFKILSAMAPEVLKRPDIRITLDTREDYVLLCGLYDYLYKSNIFFNVHDILKIFNEKPWIKLINKEVAQKKIFYNFGDEIKEAVYLLNLWGLKRVSSYVSEKMLDPRFGA